MPRPKAKARSRRFHVSGQSVVTLDGKDFYPARFGRTLVNDLSLPYGFELSDIEATAITLVQAGLFHLANKRTRIFWSRI